MVRRFGPGGGSAEGFSGWNTLRLEAARLAIDCQIMCREANTRLTPKPRFKRVLHLIDRCEEACSRLAGACLAQRDHRPGPVMLERWATSCEDCAEECERLEHRLLGRLARTCRETAKACLDLAGSDSRE